jgi:hypothetical protein
MPDSILEFIYGIDFALFNFEFINLDSSAGYKEIDSILHYDQEDETLLAIGIESTSSLINNLKVVILLGLIGLFNLALLPCYLAVIK